jgi:hypothetical protein
MSKEIRLRIAVLAVLASLTVSVVFTTPARADGGAPDPAATPAPTSATTATNLSQAPAGTSVVVVDNGGHKVPLGTQKAAEIVQTGDPIWCPAAVAIPVPGANGCTSMNADLATLMSYLSSNQKAANGIIWITGGADGSASPASLDGSSLPIMANYSLTLKGGWTGSGNTINTSAPSTFTQPISIINWNANVTLSDIQINGASASGPALNISTKRGGINLTRVHADGNSSGSGASLDTCLLDGGHTKCQGSGNVNVNSAEFNGNAGGGLSITANGAVTLSQLFADANSAGAGAIVDNCNYFNNKCLGAGNVTLTKGEFNGNSLDGLDVTSNGAIRVADLNANGSVTATGVSLNNSTASTPQPVAIAGTTNTFDGNAVTGLVVESNGVITANNLNADGNNASHTTGFGAWLVNNFISGNSAGVTITTSDSLTFNVFSGNNGNGLRIQTNGAIRINNLNANGNVTGAGALLENNTAALPQPVTLTGTNAFNGNTLTGLIVYSRGAITTYNLTADSNGSGDTTGEGDGVYLDNCNISSGSCTTPTVQPITLYGSNAFNGNYNNGLNVQSRGTITTFNLTAQGNGTTALSGSGVILENDSTAVSPVYVKTSSNSIYNTFNGNYDYGLEVKSNGAINASNLNAQNSVNATAPSTKGFGALLDNCLPVNATQCGASSAQPVILTGANTFNGNASNGLVIQSRGAVTTNNLTAENNGISASWGAGTLISNNFNSAYGVSVLGTNVFSSNYGILLNPTTSLGGLAVFSNGVITASNLTADLNSHGTGVYLNNSYALASRPVTLTGSNEFGTNGYHGLDIESFGNIFVSNLHASVNGTTGVYGSGVQLINNYSYTSGATTYYSSGTVTITGVNVFDTNHDDGLTVFSNGAIRASNLHALETQSGNGVRLDNTAGPSAQPVTLTGVNSFNNNSGNGLFVTTKGAITLSNLTADFNSGHGVELQNNFTGSSSNITLTGADEFNHNLGYGLYATSFGAITLNTVSVTAVDNGTGGIFGDGVHLDNCIYSSGCTAPLIKPITLKGTNTFDGNYGSGLVVYSKGAITAGNLTSSNNQNGWGVSLFNVTASPIQLTGSNSFYNNGHDGVTITSSGAVTLNNIISNGNGKLGGGGSYFGVWIDNSAGSAQSVTLNGVNVFNGNYTGGLYVKSKGAINASNVTAVTSVQGPGAALDNTLGSSASSVTFSGNNFFNDNGGVGLQIQTNGQVTLRMITADGNMADGLSVVNTTLQPLTLTCGVFINNLNYAVNINVNGNAVFTGVTLAGNNLNTINNSGSGQVTQTSFCPLP